VPACRIRKTRRAWPCSACRPWIQLLHDGDRIELLRPLLADPRSRAAGGGGAALRPRHGGHWPPFFFLSLAGCGRTGARSAGPALRPAREVVAFPAGHASFVEEQRRSSSLGGPRRFTRWLEV
jgi:hypothetical protein